MSESQNDARLDETERAIAARLRSGIEEYDDLPPDMVVSFIRGYDERADRAAESLHFLQQTLSWRDALPYDPADILAELPSGRETFEEMYQAGPVGFDGEGNAVVVERIGRIPPHAFCAAFNSDTTIQHTVYNREAACALNRQLSHRAGRRIALISPIVDLAGLGMSFLDRNFINIVRDYTKALLNAYPYANTGYYVIYAPGTFRFVWSLMKPLLDPETIAKVHLLGGPRRTSPSLQSVGLSSTGRSTRRSAGRKRWST